MSRIGKQFRTKVLPKLKSELGLANPLAVPKLQKVVVNTGIGKLLQQNPKVADEVKKELREITGQQPVARRAKTAVSAFKVREGQLVGYSVTLRGKRMYEFFDKLINAALPRLRDFRGFSKKGFDGSGNYTLGLREHTVFPEMADKDTDLTFGVEVTLVTTADEDEQAYQLLKQLGFPFND